MKNTKILGMILIVFTLVLFSCATKRPDGSTEAEILFKEAKSLIEKSRFIQAGEKLNQIRSQFPYSYYATHAELLQADILFSQENYPEAASAYILFKDFHPKYSDLAYVVYRISESFYNQLPSTFDRDLTAGLDAIKYYNELLINHSTSDFAKNAKERIKQIEEMLIKKEIYIADYYFRTKDLSAALKRYKEILNMVSDSREKARIENNIKIASEKLSN